MSIKQLLEKQTKEFIEKFDVSSEYHQEIVKIADYLRSCQQEIIEKFQEDRIKWLNKLKETIENDNKVLNFGATLNNETCGYGCVKRVLEILSNAKKSLE